MKQTYRVFIVAGEVSGDVLGANIINAIKREFKNVEFIGVGGENMIKNGLKSIFPMRDIAVMGFIEVLKRAKLLTSRINETASKIVECHPDIVITIDAPGFAKRVVKNAKKAGYCGTAVHVVAPAVWAWRPSRAKSFAEIFDKLYCFFDFEVPFFTKYGLKTMSVGHPIIEGGIKTASKTRFLKKYKISNDATVVTFIPGSRKTEVEKLISDYKVVLDNLSRKIPHLVPVMPVVETMADMVESEIKNWKIKPLIIRGTNERYDAFAATDVALAASGTVSVELAILHIPAIIVYRMNGLTFWLAKQFVNLKWISLVNILSKKTIYPEIVQSDVNPGNLTNCILKLLKNKRISEKMINELHMADNFWSKPNKTPSTMISKDIYKILNS